jgi:hypothetical protein
MMIVMLVFYEIRAFQRLYIHVLDLLFKPDPTPIIVDLDIYPL